MSILATETINGYVVRPQDTERERIKAQTAPSKSKEVSGSRQSVDLPRSASYTYLGETRGRGYTNTSLADSSFSEADVIARGGNNVDHTSGDSSGDSTPEERLPELNGGIARGRGLPLHSTKEPDPTVQKLVDVTGDGSSSTTSSVKFEKSSLESSRTVSTAPTTPDFNSSVTSNFSRKLNRQSWIGRTPAKPVRSPSLEKEEDITKRRTSSMKRRDSLRRRKENEFERPKTASTSDSATDTVRRKSTLLSRRKSRPVSGLFKGSPNAAEDTTVTQESKKTSLQRSGTETASSSPPLPKPPKRALLAIPKSFSTDRLPSHHPNSQSTHRAVPVPRLLSSDRPAKSSLAAPKKRDELWSVFRTLEADFSKFSSKSVALKANVVRSTLLPFLHAYATHPSNKNLRPEDLDRRANILNKWWTGLVELLHGRNNQSISGTDRPVILDGISGIMERTEWRLPPSPFSPLNQRMKGTASPGSRSTTSLGSEASELVAESVHHNVRNIFIQNLSAQMAFVVDKMSLRNAAASLVAFCGKACAYAFMFVPGMADVLVRLWDLRIDTLRRVVDGNGIGKFDNLASVMSSVVSGFPPALHQLGFTSLMSFMRKLRTPPPLPLGTNNFEWWGHWLDRWCGRESDLFYVFVKYFHILATDFLPQYSSRDERMCAPGFLLVHAQILTNLDATIHRDANQSQQDSIGVGPSSTFDDVLGEPDAVATALPVLPNNATRLMAENRSIMLVRDFLSDRAGEYPVARQMFAESFSILLQTAAQGTSMFDHAACYTLLDFLEEALVLLVRFQHLMEYDTSLVNTDFWMNVWKKMIESQNTMTQVRLCAFLYTIWNNVVCSTGWKTDLCNDLVLDHEIFEMMFNHWCPMVRAYFMRLLCWRVGRYDGDSLELDFAILETMLQRLQKPWSFYLYLREQAQQQDTMGPPSNPCNPAPSRRLMIIRSDPQLNAPTAFLSFDGIMSPRSPVDITPIQLKRSSTISNISHVIEIDTRPSSSLSMASELEPEPRGRGIGGFLRNLVRPKSRSKSRGASQSRIEDKAPPMPQRSGHVRSATDGFQSTKEAPSANDKPVKPIQHQNYSFKFSLEYQPNARPLPPMRLFPPKLPTPAQQMLQTCTNKVNAAVPTRPTEPTGESRARARYSGRALAEWAMVLGECQSFFERRKHEGVPSNKFVETPTLGVEVFRRPA